VAERLGTVSVGSCLRGADVDASYATQNIRLGGPGYKPAPSDYDGDGKADPGVYQDISGSWAVQLSASGDNTVTLQFGGQP